MTTSLPFTTNITFEDSLSSTTAPTTHATVEEGGCIKTDSSASPTAGVAVEEGGFSMWSSAHASRWSELPAAQYTRNAAINTA